MRVQRAKVGRGAGFGVVRRGGGGGGLDPAAFKIFQNFLSMVKTRECLKSVSGPTF